MLFSCHVQCFDTTKEKRIFTLNEVTWKAAKANDI